MVSGFLTSPCDHSRIFSGLAREIRIAENESGSLGFSKKLKMSRTGNTSRGVEGPRGRGVEGDGARLYLEALAIRSGEPRTNGRQMSAKFLNQRKRRRVGETGPSIPSTPRPLDP